MKTPKTHKILAVDDQPENLDVIVKTAEGIGPHLEVLQEVNARLALDIARAEQPDLIITDWEMPEMDGIAFIKALSDEFRALSGMLEKSRTTLLEEVELCRCHLRLMSLRLECEFSLDMQGVDPDDDFPPGVLHALIENAISHNRYSGAVVFRLIGERRDKTRTYRLQTPLGRSARPAVASGAGTEYVQARLAEFSPAAWSFNGRAEGDAWVSEISFEGWKT